MLKTSPHPVTPPLPRSENSKNSLPFKIRKNLVKALVLSKLYYNDVIYHSLPEYLQKRLQRVQKAAASFVLGKFARSADVLSLNWLPIKEQREWNVLKLSYKAVHTWYILVNFFHHIFNAFVCVLRNRLSWHVQ